MSYCEGIFLFDLTSSNLIPFKEEGIIRNALILKLLFIMRDLGEIEIAGMIFYFRIGSFLIRAVSAFTALFILRVLFGHIFLITFRVD